MVTAVIVTVIEAQQRELVQPPRRNLPAITPRGEDVWNRPRRQVDRDATTRVALPTVVHRRTKQEAHCAPP